MKPIETAALLGDVVTPNAMNSRLWVLCSSSYWPSISAALIRLSDYLYDFGGRPDDLVDVHGTPGRLAHRHEIGALGRIPHRIAMELFCNADR